MTILDLLTKTLQSANEDYATLTVNQQNPRGVPRHFHALFVAVAQLVYDENLTVENYEKLTSALRGIWNKDLSIPGGGNWGAERKRDLINAVKGYLRPSFKPTIDQHQMALQEQAIQFESTLRMALTEKALFELKQGFCRLDKPSSFDGASFDKILCTASAMANAKPGAKGVIFIGVADDKHDAESIERLIKIKAHEINGFYVTGTQHELDALSRSPDEHFRWLIDRIKSSTLDPLFADRLASSLTPFRYNDYLLWKLEPRAGNQPVAFDGRFYQRQGPRTVEVSDPNQIIELVRRFATSAG